MKLMFLDQGWDDYLYWQGQDKKLLKRLNRLIEECRRTPFDGIGQPEPLKHRYSGFWSRRITDEHRLVYMAEDDVLVIAQCRFHYDN